MSSTKALSEVLRAARKEREVGEVGIINDNYIMIERILFKFSLPQKPEN